MRATLLIMFACPALLLAAAILSPDLFGKDPLEPEVPWAERKSPDSVFWHCELPNGGPSIPPRRGNAGRFTLTYLRIDWTQTPAVGTLSADYDRYMPEGSRPFTSICFEYRLRVGESLPMFDAMYRVTELGGGNDIRLKRTADKEFVKNLTNDRNLIVIPAESGVRFLFDEVGRQLDDTTILDVAAIGASNGPTNPRRARITFENATSAVVFGLPKNVKHVDAAVGDVIPLVMGCHLTVTKIVPPDEKRKILGWVEFSPDPPKKKEQAEKK